MGLFLCFTNFIIIIKKNAILFNYFHSSCFGPIFSSTLVSYINTTEPWLKEKE